MSAHIPPGERHDLTVGGLVLNRRCNAPANSAAALEHDSAAARSAALRATASDTSAPIDRRLAISVSVPCRSRKFRWCVRVVRQNSCCSSPLSAVLSCKYSGLSQVISKANAALLARMSAATRMNRCISPPVMRIAILHHLETSPGIYSSRSFMVAIASISITWMSASSIS